MIQIWQVRSELRPSKSSSPCIALLQKSQIFSCNFTDCIQNRHLNILREVQCIKRHHWASVVRDHNDRPILYSSLFLYKGQQYTPYYVKLNALHSNCSFYRFVLGPIFNKSPYRNILWYISHICKEMYSNSDSL